MAKKEPTELTVEEKLKTLYNLQTTLSAIDEKRALRGELPLEVEDLEDEIEGLTTRVEKIEYEIQDFQNAINQKRGEIENAQASVERYQRQLDDVKNNREYDTLTKEIEFQTLEIELCNKKIKEAFIKVDECKRDLEKADALIADRQQALEEKRNELDEIMEETKEEEDKLKAKAKELEEKIDHVCLAVSSVSARVLAMVLVLLLCSVMLVEVASLRFHHSASLISRCTRRLSFASIVVVSSLIQNLLVSRLKNQ